MNKKNKNQSNLSLKSNQKYKTKIIEDFRLVFEVVHPVDEKTPAVMSDDYVGYST